jgi:hypothetical protein
MHFVTTGITMKDWADIGPGELVVGEVGGRSLLAITWDPGVHMMVVINSSDAEVQWKTTERPRQGLVGTYGTEWILDATSFEFRRSFLDTAFDAEGSLFTDGEAAFLSVKMPGRMQEMQALDLSTLRMHGTPPSEAAVVAAWKLWPAGSNRVWRDKPVFQWPLLNHISDNQGGSRG